MNPDVRPALADVSASLRILRSFARQVLRHRVVRVSLYGGLVSGALLAASIYCWASFSTPGCHIELSEGRFEVYFNDLVFKKLSPRNQEWHYGCSESEQFFWIPECGWSVGPGAHWTFGITVPLIWFPIVFGLLGLLLFKWKIYRCRRRGVCSLCGYSLQGMPSDPCPECGTRVSPRRLISASQKS